MVDHTHHRLRSGGLLMIARDAGGMVRCGNSFLREGEP